MAEPDTPGVDKVVVAVDGTGMTTKQVLRYHICTSFSSELHAAATAAGFNEDDGNHTEKQILAYVEGLIQ